MDSNKLLFTAEELDKLLADVRGAEREACAQVCEEAPEPDGRDLAERIRARGQQ